MDANNSNDGQSGSALVHVSGEAQAATVPIITSSNILSGSISSTSSTSISSSGSSKKSVNIQSPHSRVSSSSSSSVEDYRDKRLTSTFIEIESTTVTLEHEDPLGSEKPRFYHVCPPTQGTVPLPSDTDDKIRCMIREMMQPTARCSICSTTSLTSFNSSSITSNTSRNIVSVAVEVDAEGDVSAATTPLSTNSADCSVESAASTAVISMDEENDDNDKHSNHLNDSLKQQEMDFQGLREGIKWPSHTSLLLPDPELTYELKAKEEEKQKLKEYPGSQLLVVPPILRQKRPSRASVHLDKVNDYSHRIARYIPIAKIALLALLLVFIVASFYLFGYDIWEQVTIVRIALIWGFLAIYCFCFPTFKRWYKTWENLPSKDPE